MKAFHLLLVLSLTGAVALAGCMGDDADGGESTGDQSGRELNQDIMVGEGDNTTTDTNTTDTNTTATNSTSTNTTSGTSP